jgi:hypothetical protein
MSQSELRTLLAQLHTRLGNAQSLDAADRRMLATVLADIEAALAQGESAPSSDGAEEGLDILAAKFEADHPALAETVRRIADTLGKAGI